MDVRDAVRKYFSIIGKTVALSSDDKQVPIGVMKAMAQLKGALGPTALDLRCSFHLDNVTVYWRVGYKVPSSDPERGWQYPSLTFDGKWKTIQPIDVRYKIDKEEFVHSVAEYMLLEGLWCQTQDQKS